MPRASLVIQTSFLGDMVLTTPLLAWLARDSAVDVVAIPSAAALLANHPAVREIIVYDKRGADRGVGGFFRLARRLRLPRYDTAYLAQGSFRSGALAFASGIPRRVGFETSAGRPWYTKRVPYIKDAHHAERLLALGKPDQASALAGTKPRPTLYPGQLERAAVDALLSAPATAGHPDGGPLPLGPTAPLPLIGIAPGSVWATKQWPEYAALAQSIHSLARVVVIGGPADRPLGAEIVARSGGDAIDATGRLSLLASAELIGRMRLLITNDSAPLHLASAMNTPTVAIFGPTIPGFGFGPLASLGLVVEVERASLPCRPCDSHGPMRCPLGHWRCMREITADQVVRLVRELTLTL